jgi:hypothetical protein
MGGDIPSPPKARSNLQSNRLDTKAAWVTKQGNDKNPGKQVNAMQDIRYLLDQQIKPDAEKHDVDELPLPVVPNWDELVSRADRMAEVIDRHLDFESKLQGRELRPVTLCPEQRVSLVSDLTVV